jgi:Na+-translocating ferredoxin:NAD+ oxidoreductase RnfG subunit
MISFSPARARRGLIRRLAWLSLAALLAVAPDAGATTYLTVPQVLRDFFKASKKVSPKRLTLDEGTSAEIAAKLGVTSIPRDWVVYLGDTEGRRDGLAVIDSEKGMHELIDFAVRLSPSGAVERVEILEYREPYGDEVRSERFRQQFSGKTAKDRIVAGEDIDIVSGASISSRSIAVGVKRATLVIQAAIKSGQL